MTHRIYYTAPYCATFDGLVTRALTHEGQAAAVLDRTAFYPESGGQRADTGALGGAAVVDVVEAGDGSLLHVLDRPLREGDRVAGAVDWPRRFDHMQQHTGQHVLSAAFDRLFGNRTLSFHMGADASTIDLAAEAGPEAIAAAEDEANRVVWEDRPVSIRFVTPEQAAALPLRKEPVRAGLLRLIDVHDFDLSACGGTHVRSTGAIGIIAVIGAERFRGGSRLTFVCGGRMLRWGRTSREAVAGAIRSLSVLPQELPAAVDRLQGEVKDMRRRVKTLQEALAAHEAERLVAGATTVAGVRLVLAALEGWDAAGLKAIASAAAAGESAVAVLFTSTRPALAVVARSRNVTVNAHELLGRLVQQFGGRGGGKPDLAQGGGLDGPVSDLMASARAAVEDQLSR